MVAVVTNDWRITLATSVCESSNGDKGAYCVCMHAQFYWSVRMIISNPMRPVYTLKFSVTHPLFNLMCTRIKHLGKVFIKTPK